MRELAFKQKGVRPLLHILPCEATGLQCCQGRARCGCMGRFAAEDLVSRRKHHVGLKCSEQEQDGHPSQTSGSAGGEAECVLEPGARSLLQSPPGRRSPTPAVEVQALGASKLIADQLLWVPWVVALLVY